MATEEHGSRIYGLMAEFENEKALVHATRKARAAGYRRMDAYTPYPVEEVTEALDLHDRRVGFIFLAGGILGGLTGLALQWWVSVVAYPINVGGRPLASWPAWVPATFELTILGAALAGLVGMLALNGLPMPYHPVFNVPRFALASRNRFFLCIEAKDPKFDLEATRRFLETLNPREVSTVAD